MVLDIHQGLARVHQPGQLAHQMTTLGQRGHEVVADRIVEVGRLARVEQLGRAFKRFLEERFGQVAHGPRGSDRVISNALLMVVLW